MSLHRNRTSASARVTGFHPLEREGLVLASRRHAQASLAGIAGPTLPGLLQAREAATAAGRPRGKSVILLWMTGGPSHIDTWTSSRIGGAESWPVAVINTRLPGVRICEHCPNSGDARSVHAHSSVDPHHSNHEPNTVFQTANLEAEPRTNPSGCMYQPSARWSPSFGSHASMPPYVAFMKSASHLAFGGYLGRQYDPFIANRAAKLPVYSNVGVDSGEVAGGDLFALPVDISQERIHDRGALLQSFDKLHRRLDQSESVEALDRYRQQAVSMVAGGRARDAFDLSREPAAGRERYGKHLWCQQALLARRLVEAGVAFVTLDLSYHSASGTWDTHGDNIPPYGGISKGLKPLLPLFDHLITTLVST